MGAESRATLASTAERARPVSLAGEQLLPVLSPLSGIVPGGGLRRGSMVAVDGGPGATSFALALLGAASASGSWVATVGLPSLGLAAAAELGVSIERMVLVADPGPRAWASSVATLVDAFDLVLLRPTGRVRSADARRLVARARERGAVLVQAGGPAWPVGPDVRLTIAASEWDGLGRGHGHLRARRVEVVTGGRRAAGRERHFGLWLPDADGSICSCDRSPVIHRRKAARTDEGVEVA